VTWLAIACGVWLTAALSYRVFALRALDEFVREADTSPPRIVPGGSVLLLRPLCGAKSYLSGCLDSLFVAASDAGARVVIGVEDPDDPAFEEAARARDRHPNVSTELKRGPGPQGANRKVANLIGASAGEGAAIWVMSDADIRVAPDYARRIAASFEDPAVGFATCPYRSVPGPGLASRVDALITNSQFIPGTFLSVRIQGGLRFGLGATIAVRREALERVGGLESVLDECADDYALAMRFERAGEKLAWAPLWVDHVLEAMSLRDVFSRHLRWARVTRASTAGGYLGLGFVTHGLVPAVLAGALWMILGGPGGLVPLAWWTAEAGMLWPRRRELGIAPVDLLLLPAAELLSLSVYLCGLRGQPSPP
jgi:ceramide glucosyltransferase